MNKKLHLVSPLTARFGRVIVLLAMAGTAIDAAAQDSGPQRLVIDAAQSSAPSRAYSWQGFPITAQTPEDAAILVEKEAPAQVRPDTEYSYEIKVSNRSTDQFDQVELTESLPNGFELSNANPKPEVRGRVLKWTFNMLAPGQIEYITISGKATRPGTIDHQGQTRLNVSLRQLTSIVAVIEPSLNLLADAPEKVLISDTIPVRLTFRNSGSAQVSDAVLNHELPKGLRTLEGRGAIELLVGDIRPGGVKSFDLNLRADSTGVYETQFVATAADGLRATAHMRTAVQQPRLALEAKAPRKRFVGNVVPYDLIVRNTGDGVARNVNLSQTLPETTEFASANEGGQHQGNAIVWTIGSLQPGEEKTVSARVVAKQIDTISAFAHARADAASEVTASASTEVAGIAAIMLEVGDINDPVPVGGTETYVIRASNQGSLEASAVVLKVTLEEGMEFVSSDGPTKGKVEGDTVTFTGLDRIDPNQAAEWRVVVRARKDGDVRFRAQIESAQLSRPVVENEATNFYR